MEIISVDELLKDTYGIYEGYIEVIKVEGVLRDKLKHMEGKIYKVTDIMYYDGLGDSILIESIEGDEQRILFSWDSWIKIKRKKY